MKKSVTFKNGNLKIAGNLYLPGGFDENTKYPAVVTVHPGGGVKEQTEGLYVENNKPI
ncbi:MULTISPECIES: alpha/beta hydrolase [unclassified Bacillus (in: firmicutes)]|uniref:alpha/beta hydrolase n=1 Tax=unclassified Bacillus (in: firmicutes) TaxID=185979 RepID=UPI0020356625|nr:MULTISPECIES: alpha/beta hydrolase [unclassified Bacillus (in: firmicutes)]